MKRLALALACAVGCAEGEGTAMMLGSGGIGGVSGGAGGTAMGGAGTPGTGGAPGAAGTIGSTFTRDDHALCADWPLCPDGVVSPGTAGFRIGLCVATQDGSASKPHVNCGPCIDTRTPRCELFVGRCIAPYLNTCGESSEDSIAGGCSSGPVGSWFPQDNCAAYLTDKKLYTGARRAFTICTGDKDSGPNAALVCQD